MSTLLQHLRAWLAQQWGHVSPRRRRALQKRRLEQLLTHEGLSRSAARRIVVEVFND